MVTLSGGSSLRGWKKMSLLLCSQELLGAGSKKPVCNPSHFPCKAACSSALLQQAVPAPTPTVHIRLMSGMQRVASLTQALGLQALLAVVMLS